MTTHHRTIQLVSIAGFIAIAISAPPASASWWGKHVSPAGSKTVETVEEAAKDVEKTVKEAGKDVEKTAKTAGDQIHDGTVHLGHQTASNFRSVSEWVDTQMNSFCEAMGPDEDCVEDGVAVQAKSDGTVSTSNQSTGEQYAVGGANAGSAGSSAAPVTTVIIMQPNDSLLNNENLQKIAIDVAGNPLEKWGLAYPRLSDSVRADSKLQSLWNDVVETQIASITAQNSGIPRPIVQVLAGKAENPVEAVKLAYDSYNNARDVWDVLMQSHKFNWVTAVGSEVLSPEQIAQDPPTKFVPGLYPEEEKALKAAEAYYQALPAEVRMNHGASIQQSHQGSTISTKP